MQTNVRVSPKSKLYRRYSQRYLNVAISIDILPSGNCTKNICQFHSNAILDMIAIANPTPA